MKHRVRIRRRDGIRQRYWKSYNAIIGFSPQERQRIESVLNKNPKIKEKLERVFTDIEKIEVSDNPTGLAFVRNEDRDTNLQRFKQHMKGLPVEMQLSLIDSINEKYVRGGREHLHITPLTLKKGEVSDKELAKILEHETLHKIIAIKAPEVKKLKSIIPSNIITSEDIRPEELFVQVNVRGGIHHKPAKKAYKQLKELAMIAEGLQKEGYPLTPGLYHSIRPVQDIANIKKALRESPIKIRKLPRIWREQPLLEYKK